MKKLAYIDHSFHTRSKSTFFFIDLLREEYEVDVFWDEAWNGGPRVDLEEIKQGRFDAVVLFQQHGFYTPEELDSLDSQVILVPMYDADGGRPDSFWVQYRKHKFINFSKTIHERLLELGIESFYCQYFLEVDPKYEIRTENSGLRGLFWQRRGEITWNEIARLIVNTSFDSFHIHAAVDPPGYDFVRPSEEAMEKYNITISDWFNDRDEYFDLLAQANVFFAPRLYEGIGMSLLEAMYTGKCVVAPNFPTMNEYISDGLNGLLYDPFNPKPLDFFNIDHICHNAGIYAKEGLTKWNEIHHDINLFVMKP
jgi:glycosyltransferase involved in cell wall biosynthesis